MFRGQFAAGGLFMTMKEKVLYRNFWNLKSIAFRNILWNEESLHVAIERWINTSKIPHGEVNSIFSFQFDKMNLFNNINLFTHLRCTVVVNLAIPRCPDRRSFHFCLSTDIPVRSDNWRWQILHFHPFWRRQLNISLPAASHSLHIWHARLNLFRGDSISSTRHFITISNNRWWNSDYDDHESKTLSIFLTLWQIYCKLLDELFKKP